MTCATCRYFQEAGGLPALTNEAGVIVGACRRYPAQIAVDRDYWCGEHADPPTTRSSEELRQSRTGIA